MNFDNIKPLLLKRDLDASDFIETYDELLARKVDSLHAEKGINFGDASRVKEFGFVLRQILLHRAIKLFEGSLSALECENGYAIALCIRGHIETTATMGFLHNRLNSMRNGNITQEKVDHEIMAQILGSRDKFMGGDSPHLVPDAKGITSMIEYADKSVSKAIMGESVNKHTTLMKSYNLLCELCHPNFLSNSLAFTLNKDTGEVNFRHDDTLKDHEASLLSHLIISNVLLIELYDELESLLDMR